jgi:hypothetical protein
VSPSGCFTAEESAPVFHYIRGWLDPRAGLDSCGKEEAPYMRWEMNPDHPDHSQVWNQVSNPRSQYIIIHTLLKCSEITLISDCCSFFAITKLCSNLGGFIVTAWSCSCLVKMGW